MPIYEYMEGFVSGLNGYTEENLSSNLNYSFNPGSGNGWVVVSGGLKRAYSQENLHKTSTFLRTFYEHFPDLPADGLITNIELKIDVSVTSHTNTTNSEMGLFLVKSDGSLMQKASKTATAVYAWETVTNSFNYPNMPTSTLCKVCLITGINGGNSTPVFTGLMDNVYIKITYITQTKTKAYIIG